MLANIIIISSNYGDQNNCNLCIILIRLFIFSKLLKGFTSSFDFIFSLRNINSCTIMNNRSKAVSKNKKVVFKNSSESFISDRSSLSVENQSVPEAKMVSGSNKNYSTVPKKEVK